MASDAEEGVGETYTLEGDRIYTAYSRLRDSGWSAAPGIPAALVEGAVYRSLAVYGGGVVISILLGTVAALWVARGISRPIVQLRTAAQALGRRERPTVPDSSIPEIREVAEALRVAADQRMRADAERDMSLEKEYEARADAVYGWARMLRSGQVQGKRADRALEAIERNANAQVQLIDDLLDVSRVITGKMHLNMRSGSAVLMLSLSKRPS